MLEQLVLSQGISTDKQSGLTCRALSECGCSGIHHPAEPVRKVAERVLLLVYNVNPRLVRKQLPPDDDITRRNLLYRQLFTEFDKIDHERRRELVNGNKQGNPYGFFKKSPPQQTQLTKTADATPRNKSVPNENTSKFSYNSNSVRLIENNKNNSSSSGSSSPVKCILKCKSGNTLNLKQNNGCEASTNLHELNGTPVKIKPNNLKLFNSNSRNGSNSDSVDDSVYENRCPFCDWPYNGCAEQLDKHYWKACPFLTKCPQCTQVLEVAALSSHLIGT